MSSSSPAATPPGGAVQSSAPPTTTIPLGAIWEKAIQNFNSKTDHKLEQHPLFIELANAAKLSVNDILGVFEKRKDHYENFRKAEADSKWGRIRDTILKPAVQILLPLIEIGGEIGAANVPFPVVPGGKAIFVAFGILLEATKAVTERFDALSALFEGIVNFLNRLKDRWYHPETVGEALRSAIAAVFAHILDVLAIAIRFLASTDDLSKGLEGRVRGTIKRVKRSIVNLAEALMNNTEMQDAFARLHRLEHVELHATVAETGVRTALALTGVANLQASLKIMGSQYSGLFDEILKAQEDESQKADEARQRRQHEHSLVIQTQQLTNQKLDVIQESVDWQKHNAELKELEDKLKPIGKADIDAQDRPGCMRGTRLGVLEELDNWSRRSEDRHIFWLQGMAGTGKSAIARTFARELKLQNRLGGSFFCSRESSAELKDPKCIVPTLAFSLACQPALSRYQQAVLTVLRTESTKPINWSFENQINRLLKVPFASVAGQTSSELVLVVDALDEASTSTISELLDRLVAVAEALPLRLLLTSRPEEDIRYIIADSPSVYNFDLYNIDGSNDILAYVHARLGQIAEKFRRKFGLSTDWIPEDKIESLAELSGNLFIHAFTTTEYIGGAGTELPEQRLRNVLRVAPLSRGNPLKHLDDIYAMILAAAINEAGDADRIRRVLSGIVCLREPQAMRTVARLLSVNLIQLHMCLSKLHAVLHVPPPDNEVDCLTTLHASFGDFLVDSERAPADWFLSKETGNLDLLSNCVTIMSSAELHFNMFNSRSSYLSNEEQELAPVPVHIGYACLNVFHHFKEAGSVPTSVSSELEGVIIPKFFFWVEVCAALQLYPENYFPDFSSDEHLLECVSEHLLQFLDEVATLFSLNTNPGNASAPHSYISMIPFLPHCSILQTESAQDFSALPRLIEASLDELEFSRDAGPTFTVAVFSPDGQVIACAAQNQYSIELRSSEDGNLLSSIDFSEFSDSLAEPGALAFHPHKAILASCNCSGTRPAALWNTATGLLVMQLEGHSFPDPAKFRSIVFSPDGKELYICASAAAYIYDLDHQGSPREITFDPALHSGRIFSLAISPSAKYVALRLKDGSIAVCSSKTGKQLRPLLRPQADVDGDLMPLGLPAFLPEIESIVFVSSVGAGENSEGYDVRIWDFVGDPSDSFPETVYQGKELCFDEEIQLSASRGHVAVAFPDDFPLGSVVVMVKLTPGGGVESLDFNRSIQMNGVTLSPKGDRFVVTGRSLFDIVNLTGYTDLPTNSPASYIHYLFPRSWNSDENFLRRVQIDANWSTSGNRSEFLLAFPEQYWQYLQHPPYNLCKGSKTVSVDWSHAALGEEWTSIYSGLHLRAD